MKEQDLLEEIGKVSEELIAANALPDAKRFGEGSAEKSVAAKEQIIMSEKKSEYIKNPFIRVLPAIAAAAAVLVAGVIILPKTNLMRTPATSVDTVPETEEQTALRLEIEDAKLTVMNNVALEQSGSLEVDANLIYTAQETPPTVWYSGFRLEKNGTELFSNDLFADTEPAMMEFPQDSAEQEDTANSQSAREPISMYFCATDLDPHYIQNESGDLWLTAYFKVGSPDAEPTEITVPVIYQVVEVTGLEIPDMTGWDYETAKQTLQSAGLMVDKRSAYDDEVAAGQVIATDPEGSAIVKPGSFVRVTVSLGANKDTILIPNFVDMDWELAEAMAEGMGLTLQKEEAASTAPAGIVMSQNLEVGTEVPEGTVVILTVSAEDNADADTNAVRMKFEVPANVSGTFHIELLEDGRVVSSGSSFNPEFAAGVTSLTVSGTGEADLVAVLVNDKMNLSATIGTYHVNYSGKTVQQTSGDTAAAFREIAGNDESSAG
ncbi:MAG: PASTA domain-containing protein [Oscillospiraceae bacterium]|nr:PASTA domain-containing protein [Oscillospiraceae bacterium]